MEWAPVPKESRFQSRGCFATILEEESATHLARALYWEFVDLREHYISSGTLRKIPAALACRWRCVPMVFNERRLVLVVDDLFNASQISANVDLLDVSKGLPVTWVLTSRASMDAALHRRLTEVRG